MSFTFSPCPSCQRLNKVRIEAGLRRTAVCGQCQADLALHGGVSEVSGAGLRALVEKSRLPVVVDFWAPWCGPCRQFAPTFSSESLKRLGKIVFAKVNTEEAPDAAAQFGIRGIPTLIAFHEGREVERQSGALPPQAFSQWLDRVLGAPFQRAG